MLYPFSRPCRPTRSPASGGPAARKKRRGFNLIESAIVLGVVGLVIGGIWVAAASVMQKHRVQQTVDGFFFIAERINNAFYQIPISSSQTITGEMLKDMGALPDGWTVSPNNRVNSPIFPELRFRIRTSRKVGVFNYDDAFSDSDCVAFGTMLFQRMSSGKISYIFLNGWAKAVGAQITDNQYSWDNYDTGASGIGLPDPLLAAVLGNDCKSVDIDFSP